MKNITNILLAAIIAVMPLAAKGTSTFYYDKATSLSYYLDDESLTAKVGDFYGRLFTDYVNIPETVTKDEVTYTVTTVGAGAYFDASSLYIRWMAF